MRTIEEIKADMEHLQSNGLDTVDLYDRIIDYLSELITYKQAEHDGRLVALPCGVDLMKIYNELTSVCEGDGVENYTNGYRWGHKNGQIELIRKILNISEGVNHEPEQALIGGAE